MRCLSRTESIFKVSDSGQNVQSGNPCDELFQLEAASASRRPRAILKGVACT